MAGTSGGNLGTAQQILPLKKQRGHRPRKGEMPACPALLKPRSATRSRLKIVHWYTVYDFLLFNGEFKMRHNFILLIDIQGELYHIFTQHHYVVH